MGADICDGKNPASSVHFLAATGQVPPTVVMIYARRTDAECATVLELVRSSYEYALGAKP